LVIVLLIVLLGYEDELGFSLLVDEDILVALRLRQLSTIEELLEEIDSNVELPLLDPHFCVMETILDVLEGFGYIKYTSLLGNRVATSWRRSNNTY
jgi:hypothetical protein